MLTPPPTTLEGIWQLKKEREDAKRVLIAESNEITTHLVMDSYYLVP